MNVDCILWVRSLSLWKLKPICSLFNSIAVKKNNWANTKTIHVLVSLCWRAFQSEMSALLALGAPVVGVSSDTNSDNLGHWSHSTEEIDCFSISIKVLSSPSTVSHWLLVHGFIPFGILVAYLCTSLEMSKQCDINERLTKDHHEAYCLHFHFKW